MKKTSACIVPIKSRSTRVPGKNVRLLGGKPVYEHMLDHILEADCFDAFYVDTDNEVIREYLDYLGIGHIERLAVLAEDDANGNDLLVHHQQAAPGFDYYFQLYVTAPFLTSENIRFCHHFLMNTEEHDSIVTATEETGWYWMGGQPVNFRPGILPRSQDAPKVYKETTGLYGITAKALARYHCRIGASPYLHIVPHHEAVDLDTEADFAYAEYLLANP